MTPSRAIAAAGTRPSASVTQLATAPASRHEKRRTTKPTTAPSVRASCAIASAKYGAK